MPMRLYRARTGKSHMGMIKREEFKMRRSEDLVTAVQRQKIRFSLSSQDQSAVTLGRRGFFDSSPAFHHR